MRQLGLMKCLGDMVCYVGQTFLGKAEQYTSFEKLEAREVDSEIQYSHPK